jgi:hypothetical protein
MEIILLNANNSKIALFFTFGLLLSTLGTQWPSSNPSGILYTLILSKFSKISVPSCLAPNLIGLTHPT